MVVSFKYDRLEEPHVLPFEKQLCWHHQFCMDPAVNTQTNEGKTQSVVDLIKSESTSLQEQDADFLTGCTEDCIFTISKMKKKKKCMFALTNIQFLVFLTKSTNYKVELM